MLRKRRRNNVILYLPFPLFLPPLSLLIISILLSSHSIPSHPISFIHLPFFLIVLTGPCMPANLFLFSFFMIFFSTAHLLSPPPPPAPHSTLLYSTRVIKLQNETGCLFNKTPGQPTRETDLTERTWTDLPLYIHRHCETNSEIV